MDFMDDALFSEALDDFELTAFPFVPSCYISSGFCPTGPTFSTTPTLAPTCSSSLVSSSASGVYRSRPPTCHAPPGMHHQKRNEKFKMLSKAPSHKKQEMTQNIAVTWRVFGAYSAILRTSKTNLVIQCSISPSVISHIIPIASPVANLS